MKKIKTLFENYITEMELCDFTVGDRVKYDGKGKAPKYLAEYNDLFVEKISESVTDKNEIAFALKNMYNNSRQPCGRRTIVSIRSI